MPFSDWKTEVEAGGPAETHTARPSLSQNALLLLLLVSGQIQNLFFWAQQEGVLSWTLNYFSLAVAEAAHPMSFSPLSLPFLPSHHEQVAEGVPHGSHEKQVAEEVHLSLREKRGGGEGLLFHLLMRVGEEGLPFSLLFLLL